MAVTLQGAARKVYIAAQSVPGIKGYYATPGSLYDRALNKVMGFKDNSARLTHLMIIGTPIVVKPQHINWAVLDQEYNFPDNSKPVLSRDGLMAFHKHPLQITPQLTEDYHENPRIIKEMERELFGNSLTPAIRKELAERQLEARRRGLPQAPRYNESVTLFESAQKLGLQPNKHLKSIVDEKTMENGTPFGRTSSKSETKSWLKRLIDWFKA